MTELIVFLHGMWGSEFDFKNFASAVSSHAGDNVVTLRIKGNRNRTYRGVESGARTAFEEVKACIAQNTHKNINKLSLIGHSFGGLYARYLLKLMSDAGMLETLEPRIFATFATPHIGWRHHAQVPWPDVTRKLFMLYTPTTRELSLEDKEKLLFKMTEDAFLDPLKKFQRRMCYTNVINDLLVPYGTSALRVRSPYKKDKAKKKASEKYGAITEWSIRTMAERKGLAGMGKGEEISDELLQRELEDVEAIDTEAFKRDVHRKMVRKMLKRLDALQWERYDVVIKHSKAHERIVNKHDNELARSVVQHFIDTALGS